MVVVGRFPGTGVPAAWNILIDQMKSAAAKTAISAPNGIAKLETSGIGQAKCNTKPVTIVVR
jgi:hypothetical protein